MGKHWTYVRHILDRGQSLDKLLRTNIGNQHPFPRGVDLDKMLSDLPHLSPGVVVVIVVVVVVVVVVMVVVVVVVEERQVVASPKTEHGAVTFAPPFTFLHQQDRLGFCQVK